MIVKAHMTIRLIKPTRKHLDKRQRCASIDRILVWVIAHQNKRAKAQNAIKQSASLRVQTVIEDLRVKYAHEQRELEMVLHYVLAGQYIGSRILYRTVLSA